MLGTVSALSLLASCCYSRRTADEELIDFPSREAAPPDAGSSPVIVDAGLVDTGVCPAVDAGSRCTGTDAISLFLCSLTMPRPGTSTPTTGTSTGGLADLIGLLDSAGGLESIAAVLGAFTGTGRPTTGTGTATTQPSLTDLINLAGGLGNIATLLNGLLGGGTQPATMTTRGASNSSIADLIAAFGQTPSARGANPSMSGAPASLVDWLGALGLAQQPKSLGGATTTTVPTPSAADCAAPVDAPTAFVCQLQAARAASALAP